ncbi:unnamed protein product [Paramecium sonneborni]|uniref:WD40-repeat-containing domain n=1 Tax=Paramecium sonneborni TaxID=65129 RepID=A0A8S1M1H6_9CILI|nr:unnamed protein product [Paramecium sonneborni]
MIQISIDNLHCGQNHNQPVIKIAMDSKYEKEERLFCQECLNNNQYKGNLIKIEEFEKQIQEQSNKKEQIIKSEIEIAKKYVDILKQNCLNLKQRLISELDRIIVESDKWLLELNEIVDKNNKSNFVQEWWDYNNYLKSYPKIFKSKIQKCHNIYIKKLFEPLQKYVQYDEGKRCLEILQDLRIQDQTQIQIKQNTFDKIQENKERSDESEIELKLIDDSIIQKQMCYAIDINSACSLMISGKNENIVLWNFKNGKISEIVTLKAHEDDVQCLKFSKRQNSFISGSKDNSLYCWKVINNKQQWIHSQQFKVHKDWIECFLLNQNEDQLIVGSKDNSITIWNVDFKKNRLIYQYTLTEHYNKVCSLSLNQSETQLASCGYDHYIIWERNQQDQWQIKYKQEQKNKGEKIKFINDNQFIWITEQIEQIQVFEKYENIYKEDLNKCLQLIDDDYNWDESLFPIIYNIQKNIIVLRQKRYIYFIRQTENGYLKIIKDLNCDYASIYGTITDDGLYLIIWNYKSDKYLIYELQYK